MNKKEIELSEIMKRLYQLEIDTDYKNKKLGQAINLLQSIKTI